MTDRGGRGLAGGSYEGEFHDGKMHGRGKVTYPSGLRWVEKVGG